MKHFDSISSHPEIQDGAPVFSGTRIRVETFVDYMRIGVSINEFLSEFPSITRDQALEVYELVNQPYAMDQLKQQAAALKTSAPKKKTAKKVAQKGGKKSARPVAKKAPKKTVRKKAG